MNQRSLIKTDSSAQTGERRKDPDYQPREKFNQRIMKSNKGDENRTRVSMVENSGCQYNFF